jgi:hypothetical protein
LVAYKDEHPTRSSVDKKVFPKMLKTLLNTASVGGSLTNNLISGFRATGIFPLNVDKLVERLGPVTLRNAEPQSTTTYPVAMTSTSTPLTSPTGSASTTLDTSLTMFLKEKRYPHADSLPKAKRQRGDKLNITPGMPITTTTTSSDDEQETDEDVVEQEEDDNDGTQRFHLDMSTIRKDICDCTVSRQKPCSLISC